jgi:hypothetical protein
MLQYVLQHVEQSRELICKHTPAVTNTTDGCFAPRQTGRPTVGRNVRLRLRRDPTRVEAGSNTSTVTLRVIGGDENGSHKSETVKYDNESYRPVLSSERAPKINTPTTVRQYSRSGRKPQKGVLFLDRLADWPSVVT